MYIRRVGTLVFSMVVAFIAVVPQKVEASSLTSREKAFIDEYYPVISRVADEVAEEKGLEERGQALSKTLAMAQMCLETGHGKSDIFQDKNNGFGLGAYATSTQTVYQHAYKFDTVEDSVRYYFEHQADSYVNATQNFYANRDPYAYVGAIASKYAEASNYEELISGMLDRITVYVAEREMENAESVYEEASQNLEEAVDKHRQATRRMVEAVAREYSKEYPLIAGVNAVLVHEISVSGYRIDENAAKEGVNDAKEALEEAESYFADSEAVQTLKTAVMRGRISSASLSQQLSEAI